MDVILDPFYHASLVLAAFFAVFLVLPARYFKLWLRWIFSWGLPLSVLLVAQNITSGGGLFPIYAREVIYLLGIFFAVLTILFIGIVYWRSR